MSYILFFNYDDNMLMNTIYMTIIPMPFFGSEYDKNTDPVIA